MMNKYRVLPITLLFSITLLLTAQGIFAQETSPELDIMHQHAREYVKMGNYKDAEITYNQLIALSPRKIEYNIELGNVYYLSGSYGQAIKTLKPLCPKPGMTAVAYRLIAASYAAQKLYKTAEKTIYLGLSTFPQSGLLYYERGLEYAARSDKEAAWNAWLDGIRAEPGFNANYKAAAETNAAEADIMWQLLYGEIYLNMEHDTAGDLALKAALYAGWKNMFDELFTDKGQSIYNPASGSFTNVCKGIFKNLAPVMSDGNSTENLTMMRTRFITDWLSKYKTTLPYTLFSYQETLLREGWFDIYNEWLFGEAESKNQYGAWNKFHEGDMAKFLTWHDNHILIPVASDGYNTPAELLNGKKKKR